MDLTSSPVLHFLGRFHPLVVHFPIALLCVAGWIEAYRALLKRDSTPSPSAITCVAFGALGAIAASALGWLYAANDPPGRSMEDLLFWHRWSGVGLAVVAAATWITARAAVAGGAVRLYRGVLAVAVITMVWASHLGGEMVYGEEYLWEVFERTDEAEEDEEPGDPIPPEPAAELDRPVERAELQQPAVADLAIPQEPEPEPEPEPVVVTDTSAPGEAAAESARVDYLTQIAPIFEERCGKCHGASGRAKAGLRLHDMSVVFEGDSEWWVMQPFDSAGSYLVELISKPADDDDVMPSEGDPLTAEQIQLIADWIDQGAPYPPATESEAAPAEEESTTGDSTGADTDPGPAKTDETGMVGAQREALAAAIIGHGGHAATLVASGTQWEVNLGLAGARTTDATLLMLSGFEPDLVALDLSRSAVTDVGIATLTRFAGLRRLRLDATAVGDGAMIAVGQLAELRYLNLAGTRVTDAGLDALAGLAQLTRLYLWKTHVTDEGVKRMADALPELEIVRGESS